VPHRKSAVVPDHVDYMVTVKRNDLADLTLRGFVAVPYRELICRQRHEDPREVRLFNA
jgi:hypothetical protein